MLDQIRLHELKAFGLKTSCLLASLDLLLSSMAQLTWVIEKKNYNFKDRNFKLYTARLLKRHKGISIQKIRIFNNILSMS